MGHEQKSAKTFDSYLALNAISKYAQYPSILLVKADFQSVEFSERAEILLFERENVTLKLNG